MVYSWKERVCAFRYIKLFVSNSSSSSLHGLGESPVPASSIVVSPSSSFGQKVAAVKLALLFHFWDLPGSNPGL
jgi:hypothetical protein